MNHDNPNPQTTNPDEDAWPEFKDACSQLIRLARKLRPRLVQDDDGAAEEFGREAGALFAKAGTTKAEGNHYMQRILMIVLAEPQA